ncbi:MAG TPA: hypothetical protein VM553_08070 [Dongiaceae bacterium]|nr:hypothetical protein [Dongiaceae bacterium]
MKKLILASLALFGACAASHVLAADNRQNYNGSYCDAYYGSQANNVNHQYNGIYNGLGGGMYVSCPVIVDEANVTTGTNNVWIHTSAAGTSCTLFSMNGNGTSAQSQWGSGGPGWFAVPNLTVDDYWGSYSMYCYLPGGATLNTISISEKP